MICKKGEWNLPPAFFVLRLCIMIYPIGGAMTQLNPGEYEVVLNNVLIHYTIRGSGPVLLAHSGGPGMDARVWDDFAGIDDFVTLVVIHPRGSGLSGPAGGNAYLLPDYAADVEALRVHLGLERPILMGWSHGGMVAQQFACTYPNSLSTLILFDTSAYFGEFLSDVEAAVQEFKNEPWFDNSLAALKAEWAGDYATDEDMAHLWAEEMKFYFKKFDVRAEAYHGRTKDLPIRVAPLKTFNDREAAGMDLRPNLAKIIVPTLVIVGRHDFITNVAMAEEMVKHIPDARLEIFEDSGHFAHVEEPKRFYRVIKEFINS
jgi:proline iminopeptidase